MDSAPPIQPGDLIRLGSRPHLYRVLYVSPPCECVGPLYRMEGKHGGHTSGPPHLHLVLRYARDRRGLSAPGKNHDGEFYPSGYHPETLAQVFDAWRPEEIQVVCREGESQTRGFLLRAT